MAKTTAKTAKTEAPAVPGTLYLVVYGASIDDLPILLTASRKEAIRTANSIEGATDPRVRKVAQVLGRDVTTGCVTVVVTLRNGKPYRAVMVKNLEK